MNLLIFELWKIEENIQCVYFVLMDATAYCSMLKLYLMFIKNIY